MLQMIKKSNAFMLTSNTKASPLHVSICAANVQMHDFVLNWKQRMKNESVYFIIKSLFKTPKLNLVI